MKWYDKVAAAGPEFKEYFNEVLSSNFFRQLPNNTTLVPKGDSKNSFLVIQKLHSKFFFCPDCDDCAKLHIREDAEDSQVREAYCKHSIAAEIIEDKDNVKAEIFEAEKDHVYVVAEKPFPVCVIFPSSKKKDSKGAQALPGVLVRTAKMSKNRCKTCKGRDGCVHLNIFREAQDENDLAEKIGSVRIYEKEKKTSTKTDLIETNVNLRKKPELAPKSKTRDTNPLNPNLFHGKEVNVFKQSFNYPPTKDDREKNNKINKEDTLFPNEKMIPPGEKCEKCGNKFTKVELESNHPIIHHSRPTKDSRNSSLSVYLKKTSKCNCLAYYHGEDDRLVRVSPPATKVNGDLHFVSVDLLNEYLRSLYGKSQEGKSIDAFINNKNSLNSEDRDDTNEIPVKLQIKVFQKAFEIYLHATKYDTETAFGCELCPKELMKGESEENYDETEVHICDGIDMGCKENESKGFIDKDVFSVEKVQGELWAV